MGKLARRMQRKWPDSLVPLMKRSTHHRLFCLAIFALGAGLCAAADQPSGAKPSTQPPATQPAKPAASASSDVQKLADQFNQQRDAILAQRQALIEQLKSATDKQRAEILKKIQDQQKQFEDAQRALYKQLRDDLRKDRVKPPGK